MHMSKGVMVFGLMVLIMGSFMVQEIDARSIDYGAIGRGETPDCSNGECNDTPANPYTRGCNPSQKCRGRKN